MKATRGVLPPWLSAAWILPASVGGLAGLLLDLGSEEVALLWEAVPAR